MDIKESMKTLIKQSIELLKKLENDENDDASLDDLDLFDKIIEDSKNLSSDFKSKRLTSQHNGKQCGSLSLKLVPIEKLTIQKASKVLEKSCIELSDSDNETPLKSLKPKSNDTEKTSKASILKSVFSPSKENTPKKVAAGNRICKVNLKRVDLNRIVASHGLELLTPINKRPKKKSSKLVRFLF